MSHQDGRAYTFEQMQRYYKGQPNGVPEFWSSQRNISVRYHCLLAQASTASATFKTIGTHVPYFGEDCKTGTHWNLPCTTFGKTGLFEFMIAFGMSTFLSTCDML